MPTLCLVFQAHLPYRLQRYRFFDIGKGASYLDPTLTREVLDRHADQAFLPANSQILELAQRYGERFGVSFALSGSLLEQMAAFRPDLLASFRELAQVGKAEFLLSPYYHSFSFLYNRESFSQEVRAHAMKLRELLDIQPEVFCHPGLLYINYLGYWAQAEGLKGMVIAPASSRMEDRSLHRLYHPPHAPEVALNLADTLLADSAVKSFRQGDLPNPGKTLAWDLHNRYANAEVITLYLDYGWLGMEAGLGRSPSEWLSQLVDNLLAHPDFRLATPSQARAMHPTHGMLDMPGYSSQAGEEAPLSPWRGNALQEEALEKSFTAFARAPLSTLHESWRHLQSADHFAAMNLNATQRPAHSEPFRSHLEAYRHYLNMVADFELGLV